MMVGSTAVSIYQIGGTFNNMVLSFSTSISGVLAPKITGMVFKDATSQQLSELFIRVGRIQYLVIGLIMSGFAAFGSSFVQLWVGEHYRDSYWITILTLFPLCVPLIQNTGRQILMAKNLHKFRSVVYLVIALFSVVTTWLTVPYLGGIGAAFCSCLSYLVGHGIVMNMYYYKVIHLDIPEFWKQIGKLSVIPAILMVLTLMIQKVIVFDNWLIFFAGVIIYTALYCLGMYCFSMNSYEKDLIRGPLNKILRLLRRK